MKNPGGTSSCISSQNHLFDLLTTEFDDAHRAFDLFDEFLQQETYNKSFCLKLLGVARQGTGIHWSIRRLATLMLEHQMLRIHPDNLDEFDFLLAQLNLKQAPGVSHGVVSSVLKEGYSATNLRCFIPEFRRKLERLNRVHDRIRGRSTTEAALIDFIEVSRHDCRLSLARYLFTPEEIVDQILRQVLVTVGVRDVDTSQPPFVDDETSRAIDRLPDFEAKVLKRLCEASNIYWVADTTNSEINSLVEYPTTTVVLVIKPPGSEIEFEIKRAGRKGRNSLKVVFARDGYTVPPSHRLDGGSMQYLLRGEAESASRLGVIYRLVHGIEAPIANYISRLTVLNVPVKKADVKTLKYFTDARIFGDGFPEMRVAMAEAIDEFKAEGYAILPDLPGDVGLSARFIGVVAPTQAILCGTSSFRLDKLGTYLSVDGPEQYFTKGLQVPYSGDDARRFADSILEEILGCYRPPDVQYQKHEQYLAAAFCVAENRARADRIYLALVQQIARFWGTLLAIRGYSRGESVVARNVGLKSFWEKGEWRVKIVFMDHDALVIPGPLTEDFHAARGLPSMVMDERYIWDRSRPKLFPTSDLGYLQSIYRIARDIDAQGQALAREVLLGSYRKTQHQLLTNQKLRSLFNPAFLDRLLLWDTLVRGYLRRQSDIAADREWKAEMKKMLAAKGYGEPAFDAYMEIIGYNKAFLERYSYLFDSESHASGQKL